MEESDPAHGPVTVIHLDEHCTDKQARAKVIAILNCVKTDIGRTIIILRSPQYIAFNQDLQRCLINCHNRGTLRTFHFDEVHLFCLHSVGFQDVILQLGTVYLTIQKAHTF